MSLLDIDERLLEIAQLADIRATPITDLKEPDESGVDVGILEGGINNSSNEEVAHRMRSRCKVLVAFGDCAVFGGVPALRNMCGTQEALQRAYVDAESNDDQGFIPSDPELAVMSNVRALHEVVDVDLHVPGCPPDPDVIYYVLKELAEGRMPEMKDEKLHWH
jgi:NAD-reducing hydrogenase small subunit